MPRMWSRDKGPGECGYCGTLITFKESKNSTKTFHREAKSRLLDMQMSIITLNGEQLNELRDNGLHMPKYDTKMELAKASFSEVAFDARSLFIPHSGGKTFAEQQMMVSRYSEILRKNIQTNSIQVKIPTAIDLTSVINQLPEDVLITQFHRSNTIYQARTQSQYGVCLAQLYIDIDGARGSRFSTYLDTYLRPQDKDASLGVIPIIYPA